MDKKTKIFALEHSLKKSFNMTIPTFVDLQGFILAILFIGKKFIVKELAVLRKGAILSHYIFTCPMSWNFLTKSEKYCFLVECLLPWIVMGRRDDIV